MITNLVKRYIESESLIPSENRKVLVALSGGADSVALLRILLSLGYVCEAAHCNFHLRGEESLRDESFVRQLCYTLQVPLHVTHFDTKRYAVSERISIEMAARKLRYDWFEALRKETGAAVIAVAHHRDDSVETVLLNLIRGTGIDGLRGIRPKNGSVIRPLLGVGRRDIQDYLESVKQDYVTDSTNLEDEYTRNKIRLNILPVMETINPSVAQSIAETAKCLDQAGLVYDRWTEEARKRVMDGKGIRIAALLNEISPKALLFEILHPLGFNPAQIDSVFNCLKGQPGRRFHSREWSVLKDRDYLIFDPIPATGLETDKELPVSGELVFGTDSRRIRLSRVINEPSFVIPREKAYACLDISKLTFPLTLGKWKQGDRFMPFGMKGMKKVSDYLTDRKFSLHEKEETFVVRSGKEIVWIVGERSDNRFRVDDQTKEILLLELDV